MTINFIPGEVNRSEGSVLHGRWKDHYIIVYGSGNNLIVSSLTTKNGASSEYLQTVYLKSDPRSIDFNAINGHIAIALDSQVIIFRPVNEYMKKPQWTECLTLPIDSVVNCLQWGPVESELILGTNDSLHLYKIDDEYGNYSFHQRWYQSQPSPVTSVKITFNSSKIAVTNGTFDRLVKIWSRINYGDDNTLFELTYLKHESEDFVLDFKWRYRIYENSLKVVDGSMANIKNIRNYIDTSNNENSDTLFLITKDNILRVWSTYETSGHDQIRCWGKLDLSKCFDNQNIAGTIIIDNYYLQKTLFNQLDGVESDLASYFRNQRFDNVDLLLVISDQGQVALYLILNISTIPPNSIKFERVDTMAMEFNQNSFLAIKTQLPDDILSPEYAVNLKPLITPKVSICDKNETLLSLLFHNRLKNTIKFNTLDFRKLIKPNSNLIGTTLVNKFQGHDKSIRKLFKSNRPFHDSLVLSTSNFPEFNYLWEPIVLHKPSKRTIITKRYQIDLTRGNNNPDNYIVDALIINYVRDKCHLVLTYDKLGYLSLWECKFSDEDNAATLLHSEYVVNKAPKVLKLAEISEAEYLVIVIFEWDECKCWKIQIGESVEFGPYKIGNLPPIENYKISTVENLTNDRSSSLITVSDSEGTLTSYSLKYHPESVEWYQNSCINTNIKNPSRITGSSLINKLAIIDESETKLYIWNMKTKVLEYEELFDGANGVVKDIDWCLIKGDDNGSSNVLLAIGFLRFVLLYTELRYDYTNHLPTYSTLKKIDISDYTPHEIGDSIWINNGYLVIGCGNQFFIDDRWLELGSSSDSLINSMTRQLVKGYTTGENIFDISDIVKILNGPLPFYHPQFMVQLLYMNEFSLVKTIIVQLFKSVRNDEKVSWHLNLDIIGQVLYGNHKSLQYESLFDETKDHDIFSTFNETLINLLLENLTKVSLPLLTRHQQITLTSVITITKDINHYSTLLDENGIRFLLGFKLFRLSTKQTALHMRDINFALHSRNKDLLIDIVEEAYEGKFTWDLIKSLGLVYWVDNVKLVQIVEILAKTEFNRERDPSGIISLLYVMMNKKQILIGLWRTVSHREKEKILKFITNDFSEERWKVAAMKNAFALLGKHRYLDASYFFLLGDKVLDACNIIHNKMADFQLSLLTYKIYNFVRGRELDKKSILESYLLKDVVENGDKWTNSWIFWELGDKQRAVQALIKSPIDLVKASDLAFPTDLRIKHSADNFLNDDPASIHLYNSIKSKNLEYLQGSNAIDLKEETEFLLKVCNIYTKMGCDYLALILLSNWKFDYTKNKKTDEVKPNGFSDFKPAFTAHQPPPTAFEEPDMSSFDFGF